jgi:hypothetical protein
MTKKTAAILIGAGAGFGLAWLFRKFLLAAMDAEARIEVEDGKDGAPRVSYVTAEVLVRRNGHVRWFVNNHSASDVKISLADWQDLNHHPVSPAVEPEADDSEQPEQVDLSRYIPAGKHRQIRGRARGPHAALIEPVKYSVYLGSDLAVDPIVKLVP